MIEDNLKEHNSEMDSTAEESTSEPSLSEPNADHKRQIASWVKDGMGLLTSKKTMMILVLP